MDGKTMEAKAFTRREFLKGLLASAGLCALGPRRLFAVPLGWRPSGTKRLTFGVMSDSHYMLSANMSNGPRLADGTSDVWVLNALKYFKSRNVDAVMHCGDMANWGLVEEMQLLAKSWFSVFPDNKAPDGHEVVKLFVPGNHDTEGFTYNPDRVTGIFGNAYPSHLLVTDLAASWKSIWKEDYAEAWHKIVNGYHFFGYNTWNGSQQELDASEQAVVELVTAAGAAGELDGAKPFFLMSHIRPRSSVNAPLAAYTNGLGFFGHLHKTCALWSDDEITWWEGGMFPRIQCPALHCTGGISLPTTRAFAKSEGRRVEGGNRSEDGTKYYQGFVVEVYDDAVVIERHDFGVGHANAKIGPDWVMPIADERYTKANHPFSQAELRITDAELGAPQFPSGAALAVSEGNGTVRLTIPRANGNANTRALIYNVEFATDTQESLWKSVYAAECDHGTGYEYNGGVTVLDVSKWDIPPGREFTVRAYPVSPLGLEGEPLFTTMTIENRVRVEIDKIASLPSVGGGRYVLTQGANLPNANNLEFVLPKWVERATVEDGEIVIYVKPDPFSLRVR